MGTALLGVPSPDRLPARGRAIRDPEPVNIPETVTRLRDETPVMTG
jgi:hypothetical protein